MLDDALGLGAEADLHPLGRHFFAQALADLAIEAAQEAPAAIGERGIDVQAVEDGRELHGDIAAADHHDAPRQALEMERLVRGDGMLASRNGRHLRPRARGDEDVLRGNAAPVDLDRMRVHHRRAAAQNLYAGERQHALVHAVQACDLAVLVGDQRRPVEARLAHGPAVALRDLEVLAEVGRVREQLLRDAADVDAGAAEAIGLGDGDLAP